jgi:hypothetical protein
MGLSFAFNSYSTPQKIGLTKKAKVKYRSYSAASSGGKKANIFHV